MFGFAGSPFVGVRLVIVVCGFGDCVLDGVFGFLVDCVNLVCMACGWFGFWVLVWLVLRGVLWGLICGFGAVDGLVPTVRLVLTVVLGF